VARARAHFEAGNSLYAAGRYEQAIKEFLAGYELVPRPSFLLNLGQAYRRVGDLTRAKEAYLGYVRSLPENNPLRDQALKMLAEIEVQLRGGGVAPEHPPPAPVPPPPNPTPTSPPVRPAPPPPALAVTVPAPPRAPDTSARRWVGVGLMATGLAATGAGVDFELRAKQIADRLSASMMFDYARDRTGRRYEAAGIALIAVGGALAATGAVLFLWPKPVGTPRGEARATKVALVPSAGPAGVGAVLAVGF
jgi:tetratricopeptide (TPR) repeat protein